ncbi:MAG: hypothetical protein ABJZ62_01115 [Hyphomicrobiales bacterium]
MSWLSDIQLRDLEAEQRLEITCKKCGLTRYENPHELLMSEVMQFAYLDEVQDTLTCKAWGCHGRIRLALSSESETEGFVGGLA